ncbi:Protein of unknown function [Cotesia congregata]|uniref:BTB domain-containing protein n=1 Tax=Cotesia congregata TaxID=51543 RepID=A0A8J2HTG1_COTCN|nr:Protein of unknown function [Cotesia congregata]
MRPVCVYLTVYDDYAVIDNSMNLLNYSERKLREDFEDVFVFKKKCDVTIHFISIAHSSVFEAMFSYNMKENKQNKVTQLDTCTQFFKKVFN